MWYASAMNYDMMSPNPWNTMNLHMNQLWDHSAAWNNMFSVPQYSFDNFMPYGNMYGNSYLTNPFYTLNQMSWGTPAWNNTPWNNNSNVANGGNMWSPWGWNGGNFNGGSSNNANNNSNTNSTANRKYTRLLSLVNQLVQADDILSPSQIDNLNDAKRNTKGTTEEKYERLLEAYNDIDKDTIREFLRENGYKLGVSSDVKGQEKNKDTFRNRLLNAGFEYESIMDDKVEEFYDEIATLKDNDGTSEIAEGIIALIDNKTYDILDFISSWNNNYKEDSDSSRVIDHFAKYYDEMEDKEQKDSAKKILKLLVAELIDKANDVKKSLDTDSKEAIEDAIHDVREALKNSDDSVAGDLSGAFDKLYLYTRQGAMTVLRNDAKTYYGEIDSAVFNDKLFTTDVYKDLISEGFTDDQIKDTGVAISERKAKRAASSSSADYREEVEDSSNSSLKGIDKKSANEQVSILVENGALAKTEIKHNDKVLYQETTMTGDSDGDGKADYSKLYYIAEHNGHAKLLELQNSKIVGNEVKKANENSDKQQVGIPAKASEISKAKKEVEKEDKKSKDSSNFNAKNAGEKVSEYLDDWGTDEDYQKKIAYYIDTDNINENTILDFLDGYYTKHGNDREGLMEQLDDDCDNTSIVTITMKKNLIESTLKKAKALGLEENVNYVNLKDNFKDWKNLHGSDKDFKAEAKDDWWWLNWTKYSEAFETDLKPLYEAMKEAQASA